MSVLTVDEFEKFFAEVHDGSKPYSWQSKLVRDIAAGSWPDQISAPTGAGKSVLADALVFLRALAVAEGRVFPRRFALVVDRRALVDSQASHARDLAERIAMAESGVLATVRELLASPGGVHMRVTVMRGGIALDDAWMDDPAQCQIICVTPELLGSRLLFRGYLATRLARPRAAGLLAYDTVVVLDESHLNTQLARTLRRVGELSSRSPISTVVPALRVIETTATPAADGGRRLTIDAADSDDRLARRLDARKVLVLEPVTAWPAPRNGKNRSDLLQFMADSAQGLRRATDGTVGVIVNRVQDAVDLARIISSGRDMRVQVLVGPMRPYDRAQLEREHPRLLTPDGDDSVDVLVATQTVEVGVDLDLRGLVTEAAPGPALVQRLGRVNRRGLQDEARVIVFGPEKASVVTSAAPYTIEDIEAAMAWLRGVGDGADLSPRALASMKIPGTSPRRLLLSRLEPAEAALLSRTSEALFAEPELDLWLRDDLEPDRPEVAVVGRRLPTDAAASRELLGATPPQAHELYPTHIGAARAFLVDLTDAADMHNAFLWRGGQLLDVEGAPDISKGIRAGDILVLDEAVRAATRGVFVGRELAETKADDALARKDPLGDVLEAPPLRSDRALVMGTPSTRYRVIMHNSVRAGADTETVDHEQIPPENRLLDLLPAALRGGRDILGDDREAEPNAAEIAAQLPGESAALWQSFFPDIEVGPGALRPTWVFPAAPDARDSYPWLVVASESAGEIAPDFLQEKSTSTRVLLQNHQRDVGDRAASIAHDLGLQPELVAALKDAGLHHDDGKQAAEWQLVVSNRTGGPPLAKSGMTSRSSRRGPLRSTLPRGWRHEQYSVALAWENIPSENRELIARLIGTSHGHGRMSFPHGSGELVRNDHAHVRDLARELFDHGTWDEIVDSTDRVWGIWGAAYLEAILRAADIQVSKEGH